MSQSPFPENNSLEGAYQEIEKNFLDLEPKARDLNRHLTDLLGPCPGNVEGQWAFVAHDSAGNFHIALESIPTHKVLALVARMSEIADLISDEIAFTSHGAQYQPNLGPLIVGDAAQLKSIPTTHVRVVRPS
jgi:hypothetical protein